MHIASHSGLGYKGLHWVWVARCFEIVRTWIDWNQTNTHTLWAACLCTRVLIKPSVYGIDTRTFKTRCDAMLLCGIEAVTLKTGYFCCVYIYISSINNNPLGFAQIETYISMHMDSLYKDATVMRPSYLYNMNSNTSQMVNLYCLWDSKNRMYTVQRMNYVHGHRFTQVFFWYVSFSHTIHDYLTVFRVVRLFPQCPCCNSDESRWRHQMKNIFLVSSPLWGVSTKASDEELWCFLWSAPGETVEQTLETMVIWDDIAVIMTSL